MAQQVMISKEAITRALLNMKMYPNAPRPKNGIRIKMTRSEMNAAYKRALEAVKQEANA